MTYMGVMMNETLYNMMNWPLIEGIEFTDIDYPCDILGQSLTDNGLLIQTFAPDAVKVEAKIGSKYYEMEKMSDEGFFAVLIDSKKTVNYKLAITYEEDKVEIYDAYAFEPNLPIKELRKFNAGIGYDAYLYMGAHPMKINGVSGVRFAVWAPYAVRVSVVGDFNNWDGRIYQMSRVEDTGVFTIFIPEAKVDSIYKYEIKIKGGEILLKNDPYAFSMEQLHDSASIVTDVLDSAYQWNDKEWIDKRSKQDVATMPLNIYEINFGNFMKDGQGNYEQAALEIAKYVKRMKYTHIQLMPIMEYKNDKSLGYEPSNFYAPTGRYGDGKELMKFVDYMHSQEIGVIFDFPVYQFASDENGMRAFDGSNLYEHMDPRKGMHPRTGMYMFNYARPEVTSYLIGNAFMWIKQYHADGFKMAKVAEMIYLDYDRNPGEWIPNIYGGNEDLEAIEFIKHYNSILKKTEKGFISIAEDNSGYPKMTGIVDEECMGFDLKWNDKWRKDFLDYMAVPPYLREGHYNALSLSMLYQYCDDFIVGYPSVEFINGQSSMIGRMTGETEERKFANMRLALSYAMVHPGKKMLFMGQDMAQYEEWKTDTTFSQDILNTDKHKQVNECVKKLNEIYLNEPSLYELDNDSDGFEWINNISARESILTFVRKGISFNKKSVKNEDMLLVVCNFEEVDRRDYKIGVPKKGKYKEIFNSDSVAFGGIGFTNSRLKQSKTDECDGREESIRVNVPGLSVLIFKFSKLDEKLEGNKAAKANLAKKKAEKSLATAEVKTKTVPKTDKKAVEKKPIESKAVEKKLAEKKPVEKKPVEKKSVEKKVVETKPVESKAVEKKPAEKKPVVKKVVETKPAGKKAVEKKPAEKKPAEKKSASVEKAKTVVKGTDKNNK